MKDEEYKHIPYERYNSNYESATVSVPIFEGIPYQYSDNPMDELSNTDRVIIRQQAQFLEQIIGCESPNRYYVFSDTQQGMKLLFKCKEFSTCFMRNCCPASSREFKMDIKHIKNRNYFNEDFSNPFVQVNRPFKCSCFCCCRPEMFINQGYNTLGRIIHQFTCCDPKFYVYNNVGLKYIIEADCCQCGLVCSSNICGKLSQAVFNIHNVNDLNSICGNIIKRGAKGGDEILTNADTYDILFPKNNITPQEKMVLIVAGLMIDYQYFEQSPRDKQQRPQIHIGGYSNI